MQNTLITISAPQFIEQGILITIGPLLIGQDILITVLQDFSFPLATDYPPNGSKIAS
jgi:hypothetical protein